jgi:hypothetical protein
MTSDTPQEMGSGEHDFSLRDPYRRTYTEQDVLALARAMAWDPRSADQPVPAAYIASARTAYGTGLIAPVGDTSWYSPTDVEHAAATTDAPHTSSWPDDLREAAARAVADLSAIKGPPDAEDYRVANAVLAAIAPPAEVDTASTKYHRAVLMEVLVQHQRIDSHLCLCGGLQVGTLYSAHVANMYEAAALIPRHLVASSDADWEWGVTYNADPVPFKTVDERAARLVAGASSSRVHRRRPGGPWEPVD